jgi:hypothetical protein
VVGVTGPVPPPDGLDWAGWWKAATWSPVPLCLFGWMDPDMFHDEPYLEPFCTRCWVPGCVCEYCDFCERNVNPYTHFGPDHDYGQMQYHSRMMAAAYGSLAALPLPGCPPDCWYCARCAELIRRELEDHP